MWLDDDDGLSNWEQCRYIVPEVVSDLKQCARNHTPDCTFVLESTPWAIHIDLEEEAIKCAENHRTLCWLFEADEEREPLDDAEAKDRPKRLARLCEIESHAARLAKSAWDVVISTGSAKITSKDKFEDFVGRHRVCALRELSAEVNDQVEYPIQAGVEEVLQTRLISVEEVRRDLHAWKPSMVEECTSLVHTTGTCEPLDQERFAAITGDPTEKVEVLPGKAIFSIKAKSGRKKTRIVGCGNFQQGSPRSKLDTHASGISAEAIRLLVRFAGHAQWTLTTTDIKTAFLNAPIVTPNEEKIIVRVPSILRAANVCQEPYWLIRRALYGLDVAPRSWTLHRNQTLSEMTKLVDGTPVSCKQTQADSNLWEVFNEQTSKVIAWIGVYVDDLLIATPAEYQQPVVQTLRTLWTTSDPEVVGGDGDVGFAGFELRKGNNGFILHQRGYTKEMINQWIIEDTSATPSVREPPQVTDRSLSLYDLTKRAQGIAGQLLWVSTHTRPDVMYAVQSVCQLISTDPAAACDAGIVVLRYLNGSVERGLEYGPAPDDFGLWNELQFRRSHTLLEVFTDASFGTDESCRSHQCAMMYWGGCLVMWSGGRQSLIAGSTAEAELISMVEGYNMARAFMPTLEALCRTHSIEGETPEMSKVLYGDNSAAIQLTQLDAGAWRTRHLRLRGTILRQASEQLGWRIVHLPGLYMPADLGTKVLGPARFGDLLELLSFARTEGEGQRLSARSEPQVAQALVLRVLLTILVASQVQPAESTSGEHPAARDSELQAGWIVAASLLAGFWGYIGCRLAKWVIDQCCKAETQVKSKGPTQALTQPLLSPRPQQAEPLPPEMTYEGMTEAASEQRYHPSYEDLAAAYPSELQALVPRSLCWRASPWRSLEPSWSRSLRISSLAFLKASSQSATSSHLS